MSRRNCTVNKNMHGHAVNTISFKHPKNEVGGQNIRSSKTSTSPSKIPKLPLPSRPLSIPANSVATKEHKRTTRVTKASGTWFSKEANLLPVEADKQSEPLQKPKKASVKVATGLRNTSLEKFVATKEISRIGGNKHSNPMLQPKEAIGVRTEKRIHPVVKIRGKLKSSVDKRSDSTGKSKEAFVKAVTSPSMPEETKVKTRQEPKETCLNTGTALENAGSESRGKAILCREYKEVSQTTVGFISNDDKFAARSKGGSGHFRHCRYPWCAANDPDYAVPYAVQSKKYSISKRRLLKHETIPKSEGNQMVSSTALNWNRVSTSQSTHQDGCLSGIDSSKANQSCRDDGGQFAHDGGTDSVPSEFNSSTMTSFEGNTENIGGTAVESSKIRNHCHSFSERSADYAGGNRSESCEVVSDAVTYFESHCIYTCDAKSQLPESKHNEHALFEIICDDKYGNSFGLSEISSNGWGYFDKNLTGCGSGEIKTNDWVSCGNNFDFNSGTGYESPDSKSNGQSLRVGNCCYNASNDFESPEIKNDAHSSSEMNCDHNAGPQAESQVKSTDQVSFDWHCSYNSGSDSESVEIENNYLTSFDSSIDYMESDGNQVRERSNQARKVQRKSIDVVQEHDAETVRLRKQMIQERKQAGEYLIDSAIEEVIHKLAPNGDARVKVLVEAYEIISHNEGDMLEPHHLVGNHEHHNLSDTSIAMHC